MDVNKAIQSLEAEWDLDNGFLGRLRSGDFDEAGARRLEQFLRSIRIDKNEMLDRRFVALTWYIPLFMSWQEERVGKNGGDVAPLTHASNAILSALEDLLGVP